MIHLETEGVVLRSVEYRETDRLVTLYTQDYGRLSVLARHATKSRRRFTNSLGTFQLLHVKIRQKTHSPLGFLESARPLCALEGIYREWHRIAVACLLVDLVGAMTREGSANHRLFHACKAALLKLNAGDEWAGVVAAFEWQLLHLSGFKPRTEQCVRCGRLAPADETVYWVHGAGGIHCKPCRPSGQSVEAVSPELRAFLQSMEQNAAVRMGNREGLLLATLLYDFICHQIGSRVRSWQFLEQVGVFK